MSSFDIKPKYKLVISKLSFQVCNYTQQKFCLEVSGWGPDMGACPPVLLEPPQDDPKFVESCPEQ